MTESEKQAHNDAIKECIRIINAHSKTGYHLEFWNDNYRTLLEERQREPLVKEIKALLK